MKRNNVLLLVFVLCYSCLFLYSCSVFKTDSILNKPGLVSINVADMSPWSDSLYTFYIPKSYYKGQLLSNYWVLLGGSDYEWHFFSRANKRFPPTTIYFNYDYGHYTPNYEHFPQNDSIINERFSESYRYKALFTGELYENRPPYMILQGTETIIFHKHKLDSIKLYWKDIRDGFISYGYSWAYEEDVPMLDSLLNSIITIKKSSCLGPGQSD